MLLKKHVLALQVIKIQEEQFMKRFFSLLLCLAVCFGCSLTAFAGGPISEDGVLAVAASEPEGPAAAAAPPNGLTWGTTYTLKPVSFKNTSSSLLTVKNGTDWNGTPVNVSLSDDSIKQRFCVVSSGSYYKLAAVCSSERRVLDVYRNSDNSITSGCKVDIWTDGDDGAQQLIIEGGSYASPYVIRLASNPNLALTAVGLENGVQTQFKTYTGDDDQRWFFFGYQLFHSRTG